MGAVLLPPFLAAAGLLVLAGALKLAAGGGAVADRALGLGEVALGFAALVAPGRATGAALGGAYLVFALVAARRARSGAGCGCFGAEEEDEPAGALHVGLDLGLASVGLAAALAPVPGLSRLAEEGAGAAGIVVLAAGASTWALYLAFTVLPGLWRAWGEPA